MAPLDETEMLRRDVLAHAKTITELTTSIVEIKQSIAIKEVKDELTDDHREQRLSSIENRLSGISRLGWWILAAFGGSFITLAANFIFKGGLVLVAK